MKKIHFLDSPAGRLEEYFYRYREFYREIYTDTGLWNEQEILDSYAVQSKVRKIELLELLITKLSPDTIVGYHIEKGLHIPWRSKGIWIKWTDDDETRTIIDLKIQ